MIIRYLRWIGYEAEVFNVGSYRRKVGLSGIDAAYFSEGREASANREQLAMAVQEMMYEWLQISDGYVLLFSFSALLLNPSLRSKGRVAIFDATNTTIERRKQLCSRARNEQVSLLFVESICDDQVRKLSTDHLATTLTRWQNILDQNYDLKLNNDDYKGMDPVKAKQDFVARVEAYQRRYQTIEDMEDHSHIRSLPPLLRPALSRTAVTSS
jgi:hypothetical protein